MAAKSNERDSSSQEDTNNAVRSEKITINSLQIKLIIPTIKDDVTETAIVSLLERCICSYDVIIQSDKNASAAQNRNKALSKCNIGDLVIMIDDDILTAPVGWDALLMSPLLLHGPHLMSSPRLRNDDDTLQWMPPKRQVPHPLSPHVSRVNWLPSACIAFTHLGLFFNEGFKGSGYEDLDYCCRLADQHHDYDFVICEKVHMMHKSEKKLRSENADFNLHLAKQSWTKNLRGSSDLRIKRMLLEGGVSI